MEIQIFFIIYIIIISIIIIQIIKNNYTMIKLWLMNEMSHIIDISLCHIMS
jgi:hypothetical protein